MTQMPEDKAPPTDPPLSGIHTAGFAQIIDRAGFSLAVTTYQAGKLVLLRPEKRDGAAFVNTHFRTFRRPMGFAWEPGRFAMGTTSEVHEFIDMPDTAPRPADKIPSGPPPDGSFVPRVCHTTGDIQIHEMLWLPATNPPGRSELWFINTRFSCIAKRSDQYSFIPRWQPPFITALAPEDRCHLNGMCLRDGEIRYVSALSATDIPLGWRANKKSGGVLMDLKFGQIMTTGLSMPHSPRWHDGKLWLLESGNGGVGTVDPTTGNYTEVCRLPGFTRGLDFVGPFAFVGLSQVRDSSVFSGIAIADLPLEQRCCGVWCVDTRSGQVAGYLKFNDAVREIFAVQAMNGLRWPEVFSEDPARVSGTYRLPQEALAKVPAYLRKAKS
jgi:uncharacterized protein (TIGR03032 family)